MVDDYQTLLQTIDSNDFDLFKCVDYLRRYASDIGVHHYLAKRLHTYKYDDVEFLIPQLLQILVSFETESMALEDFILEYSKNFPHFSLIVFWNLQAYVFELKNEPKSYSFQIVRNLINKLQDILFNPNSEDSNSVMRENLQPALVLCGALAASIGLPQIHDYAKPIVTVQGKQQKSFVFKLANFQKSLTKNLTLKNQRLSHTSHRAQSDDEAGSPKQDISSKFERHSESSTRAKRLSTLTMASDDSEFFSSDEESDTSYRKPLRRHRSLNLKTETLAHMPENLAMMKNMEEKLSINSVINPRRTLLDIDQSQHSQSMPELPLTNPLTDSDSDSNMETHLHLREELPRAASFQEDKTNGDVKRTDPDPKKWLKTHYSKNVTEFILALQNISLRLSQLPKEARLSALRAELSIINDTLLPSEVDIPQLLPYTSTRNKKYHKLLKLSVNEACVLNSAERVPFLLFVEFLSDEIDFEPRNECNQALLKRQQKEKFASIAKSKLQISSNTDKDLEDDAASLQHLETDVSDLKLQGRNSSSQQLSALKAKHSHMDILTRRSPNGNGSFDMSTKNRADQMRIAAVMLQQLESSGQATTEQSTSIKNRIVDAMIALQDQFESIDYDKFNELGGNELNAGERKMENDFKLAEDWQSKKQRIKNSSIYGHLPNWDLCSVIAKNGSDLPQEAFACQLISMMSSIWAKNKIPSWTKRMKILITSANTGLVETITNAISIHSIKKSLTEMSIADGKNSKRRIFSLKDYFERLFGGEKSGLYRRAQENFAKSLASYSIICYVLQIKDRHNGNIMLDNEGHIIHIDFGFLLSNSPGSLGFEAAPFKLTMEYVEILGGVDSELFGFFKKICTDCFKALRRESELIINMVEIMQKDSNLPCFNNGDNTSVLLKNRLQLNLTDEEVNDFVEYSLIGKSLGSMYTRLYDQFQLITQGIYS